MKIEKQLNTLAVNSSFQVSLLNMQLCCSGFYNWVLLVIYFVTYVFCFLMHALTGSSCKELTCQRLAVPEVQRSPIHLLLPLLVPHLWPAHSSSEIVASNTTLNPGLNPQTHHEPMLQQKLYDQLSSSPSTRTRVIDFGQRLTMRWQENPPW